MDTHFLTTTAAQSTDVTDLIVAGGIGVFGTLLGTTVNSLLTGRRERHRDRSAAGLALADTERVIWRTDDPGAYAELRALVEAIDYRLRDSHVDDGLRKAFVRITWACWNDNRTHKELTDEGGIDAELLTARTSVHTAIRSHLARTGMSMATKKSALMAMSGPH